MNGDGHRESRTDAAAAVAAVLAVFDNEASSARLFQWRLRFASIADVLESSELSDGEALQTAAEMVVDLYSGGRNITDFYLIREDFEEQRLLNLDFETKLKTLEHAVGVED
ncbi:hypothetical protein LTV02_33880 [Nocardia yamanashiensis]|uniref:hypothetical protein n=1 Tax=Nocardia yamanashiensis TaxID=209247 RepID=UPI001E31091A|nr:hypothetical protein [Nocardia yamanashiensis]UGT40910.1 hypothetical protein LTV02_33880 [Nocardia yamanashiensis]